MDILDLEIIEYLPEYSTYQIRAYGLHKSQYVYVKRCDLDDKTKLSRSFWTTRRKLSLIDNKMGLFGLESLKVPGQKVFKDSSKSIQNQLIYILDLLV